MITRLKPVTAIALIVLGLHIVAKDDDSAVSHNETDVTKETLEKADIVKEAQAELTEKQRMFDAAATELQRARKLYIKESADLHAARAQARNLQLTESMEYVSRVLTPQLASSTQDWGWSDSAVTYALSNKGFIGVRLGEATNIGVPIVGVVDGKPADIAGIQEGDVILQVGQLKVSDFDDPINTILAIIASYKPGSIIEITLQRDDQELEIEVATVDRNASNRLAGVYIGERSLTQQNEGVIGVLLDKATDTGVPIREVYDGAPADIAGIQADDVVLSVGKLDVTELDNPTETTAALIALKRPGSIIPLKLKRDQEELDVSVAIVDRNTLNRIATSSRVWQTSVGDIAIPEAGGFTGVYGGPTEILSFPRTDNKIFVMEIEEEFGRYFDVEYGVLVLKAKNVDGIQAGDILLSIDGKPVRSLSHAIRHKQDAEDEIEIQFKRNKREKSVTLSKDQFSLHAILE